MKNIGITFLLAMTTLAIRGYRASETDDTAANKAPPETVAVSCRGSGMLTAAHPEGFPLAAATERAVAREILTVDTLTTPTSGSLLESHKGSYPRPA